MTDQPTLFDAPVPAKRRKRHRTATTSSDALDRVRPVRTHQQQVVLTTLRAYGAMTRHELAAATNLPLSSVCGRANELLKTGEVHELIERGRKVVRNGRHVLVVTIQQTRRAG